MTDHHGRETIRRSPGRKIHTRETIHNISTRNKAVDLMKKSRDVYIRGKQYPSRILQEDHEDASDYAVSRSSEMAQDFADGATRKVKETGKRGTEKVREKIRNHYTVDYEPSRRTVNEEGLKRYREYASKVKTRKRYRDRTEPYTDRSHAETMGRLKAQNEAAEKSVESRNTRTRDAVRYVDNRKTDTNTRIRKTNTTIKQISDRGKDIKTAGKKTEKATVKTVNRSVKTVKRSVKTAEKTSKTAIKTAQKTAQAARKGTEATAKAGEQMVVTAQKTAVAAQKAAAATTRVVVAAVRAAAAALTAALPIVILAVVIMAVAVLCTGDTAIKNTSNMTNSQIISEINKEWNNQMDLLKAEYGDSISTDGSRATWPEVFAIYNAYAAGTKEIEWDKNTMINMIFWDMHIVEYEVNLRIEGEDAVHAPTDIHMQTVGAHFGVTAAGQVVRVDDKTYQNTTSIEEILKGYEGRKVTQSVKIHVRTRTIEEMAEKYGFDDWQTEQVRTMTSPEFDSFWMESIYGIMGGNTDIVNVALTQVGNTGGWPYWEYCGFPSRVEWCACFVSWCAGQCGYVDAGLIPNTGSPPYQVQFFRSQGHWLDGSATPSPGMIIFFDWYNADFADHVGIVEKVEGNTIYTVEGNSSDSVRQKTWALGDSRIMGYGWIGDN